MTGSDNTVVVYDAKRVPPPREEHWKPHPRFPLYEVSDQGRHRRAGSDRVLSQRTGNRGYVLMDFRTGDGQKVTCSAQTAVLDAFEGPCPAGMESLHGDYGPQVNWWPENLSRGSRPENERQKKDPPELVPTFGCLDGCGNKVINEGRRCPGCVALAGRKIARMLGQRMNLEVVAVRFGYQSDWAYKIAVEFGGYEGTKRDARLQQPGIAQRIRITLRDRRRDGWGDLA